MTSRNETRDLEVENRMTKLESNMDKMVVAVNSLEEKVDKLNLTVSRWIGGGAVALFLGNALLAYILSRT